MHYLSSSVVRAIQRSSNFVVVVVVVSRCLIHYYFFFFLALDLWVEFFSVHLFDAGDNMHSCVRMATTAAAAVLESSTDVFIVNCDAECRWIFWISSDCSLSQFCLAELKENCKIHIVSLFWYDVINAWCDLECRTLESAVFSEWLRITLLHNASRRDQVVQFADE